MMRNQIKPNTYNKCFLLSFVIFALTTLSASLIYYLAGKSEFIAFTDIRNPIQISDSYKNEYPIGCTNKSIGSENRIFSGKTLFAYNCQQPSNPCLISICNGNRICEEQRKENATCSQDSNCDPRFKCDLDSCSCEAEPDIPTCVENSECPTIDNNNCENYTCVNETCVLATLPGMECSTNQNCGDNQFCGTGCTCNSLNVSSPGFCSQNSQCPIISDNSCQNYTCQNETCVLSTLPGMECANNQQCGVNQFCGTGCTCITINSTTSGSCNVDSDCPLVNNNPCENYTCQMGTCILNTTAGNECATSQECGESEYCGTGCTCVFFNSSSIEKECVTNSDCPTISNNPCANYTCQMGDCVLDTLAGNECSTSQECGIDELCNSTCTCAGPYSMSEQISSTLTWSIPFNGITSAQIVNVLWSKVGRKVNLFISEFSNGIPGGGGPGGVSLSAGNFPSGFEPEIDSGFIDTTARMINDGNPRVSFYRLNSDESMRCYSSIDGGVGFTNSWTCPAAVLTWYTSS